MKRIIQYVLIVLCGLILLSAKCEMLSFDPVSFFVTVKISETYPVTGNETNYQESDTYDFSSELTEAGIDYSAIESLTIQNVELAFRNNGGDNNIDFESFQASFTKIPGQTPYPILQIPGRFINTFSAIEGIVFNPNSEQSAFILGTVPSGITELTDYLSQMPPRSFKTDIRLNNVRNPKPANFLVDVAFTIQVKVNPESE